MLMENVDWLPTSDTCKSYLVLILTEVSRYRCVCVCVCVCVWCHSSDEGTLAQMQVCVESQL